MIPFDPCKFDFTTEEILENAAKRGLLSAEIEFNRNCNYRCPYCYAAGNCSNEMLDRETAESVIRQVAALGGRKIVVLGGEPLLYPHLEDMIRLITSLDMVAEIFTNGALITAERAAFFREYGCRVVVKLNTLRPEIQEQLTGVPHAMEYAMNAIRLLKEAGFDDKTLVASSVICSANEGEVVSLWKYLRQNGIKPYLEILTPQGRLMENRQLEVHPDRLKEIFEEISAFDNINGYCWTPQPPLVGSKCLRHQYSCVICANGNVIPCVGLTAVLGSIYEQSLAEIVRESVVLRKLRDYREKIKGPCRTCEKADTCYGCRGAAYQLTGDYLASDPLCWKNSHLLGEPPALPSDARQWIPHKDPIVMVDRLLEFGEWDIVEAVIRPDNRFLNSDGILDNDVIPELVAQGCAVITGFEKNNHDLGGMLTGLRAIRFLSDVRSGDILHIYIRETGFIDNYHTLDFKLRRADGQLCAEGELSICEL